jgi:ABC-2 type transport system permease protein
VSSARVIALVAGREIQTRVRERSFLLSGALSLLMIAAITLLPAFLSPDDGPARIAATDERGAQIAAEASRSTRGAADAVAVERLSPAAARDALEDEEVTAIVSARGVSFRERRATRWSPPPGRRHPPEVSETLEAAGLDAGQRRAALDPARYVSRCSSRATRRRSRAREWRS